MSKAISLLAIGVASALTVSDADYCLLHALVV